MKELTQQHATELNMTATSAYYTVVYSVPQAVATNAFEFDSDSGNYDFACTSPFDVNVHAFIVSLLARKYTERPESLNDTQWDYAIRTSVELDSTDAIQMRAAISSDTLPKIVSRDSDDAAYFKEVDLSVCDAIDRTVASGNVAYYEAVAVK